MTKKAFNEIWTSIAVVALFVTLNSVLQTQGSELFFSFPKVNDADRNSVTVYGMLISVPLLFLLIKLSFIYSKEYGIKLWSTKFPIAFNRQIDQKHRLGKQYQRFSFFIFFVLPISLQYHLLKVFFNGCLFFNKTSCNSIDSDYYSSYNCKCISKTFIEHLTNFQPFWCSWKNQYAYGSSPCQEKGEITFFPAYEAWFFLLVELGLLLYFLWFIYKVFIVHRINKH